jgi:type VI protein secretion system component VasK
MHKFLAVVLGVSAFLLVCVYWLWQMVAGEPALPLEDVALRALAAMLIVWLLGRLLGRLGAAALSEAWHESEGRALDRAARKTAAGAKPAPGAPQEPGARPGG